MPPPSSRPQAADLSTLCQFEDGSGRTGAVSRPGFRWMVLQRHGLRPLAVLGRTLLYGDNRCAGLPWWSSITLHETDAGRFALSVHHTAAASTTATSTTATSTTATSTTATSTTATSTAAGGVPAGTVWHDTQLHDSAAALRTALGRHDPLHALPVGAMAQDRDGRWLPPDIAAAWRFRTAWSGLLCVLFGLHPDRAALESSPAE